MERHGASRGDNGAASEQWQAPAEPAAEHAGERQELGVHHQLQVERRQAHVSVNRRERGGDDGAGDEHEATAQARCREHLGAAPRADGITLGERQAAVGQH